MCEFRFSIGPAEPRAFGVNLFMIEARPATASLTLSVSGFACRLFSALAMADFNVFATTLADLRVTTERTARARTAGSPWI